MADEALALSDQSALGPVPAPPPRKGLFGGAKPAAAPAPEITGIIEQINGLAARIRVSEERFNELRKKLLFIEQNLLANHKKAIGEIKESNSEIDELRHKVAEIEDRVVTVIKELRLTARKSDMDVMKRYIELWDPVKFVTADYAEKIAREIIDEKLGKQSKDQNI
jgi:septal ring factor EnvC (AmiA/AmiB activator)